MLFKCIDLLAKRILCYEAIVINSENILLRRNHKPKAPASRVLEPDTGCFRPQDPIDIVAVVELVVETLRNFNGPRWISILNDDEVVLLEERPPHLKGVKVPNGRDNDI